MIRSKQQYLDLKMNSGSKQTVEKFVCCMDVLQPQFDWYQQL